MSAEVLPRTYLYVPGNAPDKMVKASRGDADAVIIDLEDAVPFDGKSDARVEARSWLESKPTGAQQRWVRVNSGDAVFADLDVLRDAPNLTGLVLAKASFASVTAVADALDEHGLGHVLLSPLLETPDAIFDARQIAGIARVRRLQIGEYDLCAEAGITPGKDERETDWARGMVVMASAAATIDPPVAPVSVEIRDIEQFTRSTKLAARQGFVGRACIHPAQIPVAQTVFSPSEGDIEAARTMLELFESSRSLGSSVVVDPQGRLVDEATVRSARRTLAMIG